MSNQDEVDANASKRPIINGGTPAEAVADEALNASRF